MTTITVVPPATVDLAATGADAFRAAAGGAGGLVDFVNAAPGRYVRLVNDTGGSQAFGFRGTAVLTLPAGGAFVGRVGYDPLTDARNPLAASPPPTGPGFYLVPLPVGGGLRVPRPPDASGTEVPVNAVLDTRGPRVPGADPPVWAPPTFPAEGVVVPVNPPLTARQPRGGVFPAPWAPPAYN